MPDYHLRNGESIILRTEEVSIVNDSSGQSTIELMLTNQAIIHIWRIQRIFSKEPARVDRYPLTDIVVVSGQVQARMLKKRDEPCLCVFLNHENLTFRFQDADEASKKKHIAEWMDAISMQAIGQPSQEAEQVRKSIPGLALVADKIKGTLGIFAQTFAGESVAKTESTADATTTRCVGCRAPLTGFKGQRTHCQYCDTDQVL
ncbi:hypothetical protein BLEM_2195 [Bifidobacterium lemurum]|uniref:PH domain-containing protein n=1 Tax=Bifidobacterium lemurum TaxID=1603886 RepID=A0A261FLF9_9BIFI|nr:hypothetical protein [Bifidobacterium lemurum]OZG60020.1 hypothetical protein BLEM_2195 [Bifidobacterium lemurum]QOL34031.1 hypothetical protein BL8807_09825 [Bifidobacterium lemurum]